jgi:hypothetical protein
LPCLMKQLHRKHVELSPHIDWKVENGTQSAL